MKIVKVPIIGSEKNKGCEKAPDLIIESLNSIKTNEKGRIIDVSLFDIDEIKSLGDKKKDHNLIFEKSKELFSSQDKVIFLGGDHFLSEPVVRGFYENYRNSLLIVFDSHLNHYDWLTNLVNHGFDSERIIIVSLRNLTLEDMEFLRIHKISVLKMDILEEDIEGVCDSLMERARISGGFFLSIDIDSLDPAFAPGTNSPEPGGLSTRNLIYILKRLMILNNFKGAGIVNINQSLDINNLTVKVGAKLLTELI